MTLKELIEKNRKLLVDARAKLDEIKDDTPAERAAEIEAEYDRMMADYDERDAKISRLKKLEEREAGMADAVELREREAREARRPGQRDAATPGAATNEPITYEEAFDLAIRHGINALNPEARNVLTAQNREINALPEVRGLLTNSGSAGGFTVPEGFSGEIDQAMAVWGPMMDPDFCRTIRTNTGNSLPWPTLDYTGARGELKAEGGAVTDDAGQDPAFGQKVMNAYLYDSEIVKLSVELLQDSGFDLETLMDELFGESLGRTLNDVLTIGDGAAKPQGILTAAAAGKTAAAAAALVADELIDLVHSVDPAYRMSPKCRWQFNDLTLATIRKLKDGQGNYLWQMGDVRAGEPNMLLGHSYRVNQAMPDIAAGDSPILFGDHSRYVVRRVRDMSLVTLRERFAPDVGFFSFLRIDGELIRNTAVKKLTMAAA